MMTIWTAGRIGDFPHFHGACHRNVCLDGCPPLYWFEHAMHLPIRRAVLDQAESWRGAQFGSQVNLRTIFEAISGAERTA